MIERLDDLSLYIYIYFFSVVIVFYAYSDNNWEYSEKSSGYVYVMHMLINAHAQTIILFREYSYTEYL